MELKGDMNLITDASSAQIMAFLQPSTDFGGNALQFKQDLNVANFAGKEGVIAPKDSSRSFPVGQGLAVLKWRYAGTDESNVSLASGDHPFLFFLSNP